MKLSQALVFSLVVALVAGCGKKPDADSPLAFAPASTPYVFANLKPVPKSVLTSWFALAEPYNEVHSEILAMLRDEFAALPPAVQALVPLLEITEGKLSYAGMESMGLRPDGLTAFYGVDLVPVLRTELGNVDRFRQLVADFEQRRGAALPVEQVAGQDYWRLAGADSDIPALLIAIVGEHLVVTLDIGPRGPPLEDLLGLSRPQHSVLDSGELARLNDEYDLSSYGTFLLNNRRLASALSDQNSGSTALLAPPACRAELAGMADAVPRLMGGYEAWEAKDLRMSATVELREDLASALQAVPAPVPGLGSHDPVALEFGLGAHLDKLADFLGARAVAIAASPYRCEWLKALNAGSDSQQLAPLYMAAPSISGIRLALTDLHWEGELPEAVAGALVLASPNPRALVGMAQSFLPQLAQLNLQPGAEPQRLDLGPVGALLPAAAQTMHIAMSEQSIGVAVGEGASQQLSARMSAAPPQTPPLLRVAYDGSLYARLQSKMSELATLQAGDAGSAAARIDAATARVMERIDRVEVDVTASARGIQIRERVSLK